MKLWVDDIRNAPDDSWTVARNVSEAISAIYIFSEDITHISLDHDISIQVDVMGASRPYPSDETFRAVAKFIVAMHQWKNWFPILTVHSANPVGRRAILDIFHSYLHCEETPLPPCNRLENEV